MRNQITKQEKERLGNKTVFFSSVTISYALLLLFIQRMSRSTMTVEGAVTLIGLLRWTSLFGALACAAWSAYKEKKGFFLYCAMCIFVFFSTTVLIFVADNRAYPSNYVALAFSFVMAQVYYSLKVRGAFGKKVKGIFIGICVAFIAALVIYCLPGISPLVTPF